MSGPIWRVGRKVPRNLYRGDEPIAMLATADLAAEMASAMNDAERAEHRGRLACAYEIASALTHAGYPQTGNPVDVVRAVIDRIEAEKSR